MFNLELYKGYTQEIVLTGNITWVNKKFQSLYRLISI